jgi:acetoacetate decarboxylase
VTDGLGGGPSPTDEAFTIPTPEAAYSTPIDSPMGGPPPARFHDGEVLTVQYRTDPAAIRRLLPEPLAPTNDTVMVQVARWGDVAGMGRDTYEANVMVGARLGELSGCYSPYFWVTSDRAPRAVDQRFDHPERAGRGDPVLTERLARPG